MSNEFNRVLSDEEVHNLFALNNDVFRADSDGNFYTQDGGYCVDTVDLFEVGRKLEQAVLTKLAGQEPVAWAAKASIGSSCFIYGDYVKLFNSKDALLDEYFEATPVPLYAHPMPSKPYSIDKDDAGIRKLVSEAITGAIHGGLEGGEAPPVGHWLNEFYEYGAAYENMQNRVHKNEVVCMSQPTDKKACVSENAESDTQRHLEYIKRYQKWRRGEDKTMGEMGLTPKQIGEALDWLIGVAENHIADKSKMVGSDYVPDASKMVATEGWQLVPKKHTLDMSIAFAEVWYSKRRAIDDDDMQDVYDALLRSAPKPTL